MTARLHGRVARDATPGLGWTGRVGVGAILLLGVARSGITFLLLFTLAYGTVGALLAVRRPRNALGWLLLTIATGFASVGSAPAVDVAAIESGTAPLRDEILVWLGGWAAYLTWAGLVALMVLFPSGRLPSGRWRLPAAALIGCAILLGVLTAAAPRLAFNPDGSSASVLVRNPFAVLPGLRIWALAPVDSIVVVTVLLLVIGIVSMVVRFARASGVERLQLRWLVAALAAVVLAVAMGLAASAAFGAEIGGAAWIPAVVAYPTVPIAIYVAVTRYRLYEIDRIISRTIGWLLLSGILAAVFVALVVGLQSLLAPFVASNTLSVAASTLVAAALFQPLRHRVQTAVDRRFNRGRYDADLIVADFAARLRGETDLADIERGAVAAVVRGIQPATAGLWVRGRTR